MKTVHDIDALISKFLSGEATPEEAMLLEDWIAESPENEAYFESSAQLFGNLYDPVSTDEAWNAVRPQLQQTPVRQMYTMWMRIAATVVVLLTVGGVWLWMQPGAESSEIFTAGNAKKHVNLKDGTAMTIAANSSVELSPGYGKTNRSVKLKGSGYFSVKHSDQLPFIIDAGPIHIKDLGTKFDVKATNDTIYVRVDEGVVMIYDNKGKKITLNANESAHYVIATGELELEVITNDIRPLAKTIILDNQRLEDVVKLLNKTYKATIRIEDPAVYDCRITTEFYDEDLDMALLVISETLGLTIQKEGETYLLKGKSCTQ